ncbi:MAG: hypothetical protein LUQ25_01095 [Methanoregulaceae archaeon]|nr:hypothetical protein [Methanoregulaceae archaeon]
MSNGSEHMEAFFGVELNQKFSDSIEDMKAIEEDLKVLSKDIARLGGTLTPEEFRGMIKECRATAYESAQQVKDVRQFLEFYLKSDRNVTHVALERDAYMKVYQIFKWDGIDVRDLKNWIRELREICEKIGLHVEDLLNFSKLATTPIPEDLKKFPVYALDRQGYCLTGVTYDTVMHCDEVKEAIEEKKRKKGK